MADARHWNPEVIESVEQPFKAKAGIAVLEGRLAPSGAHTKPSAATQAGPSPVVSPGRLRLRQTTRVQPLAPPKIPERSGPRRALLPWGLVLPAVLAGPAVLAETALSIAVLDLNGQTVSALTDGDAVRLRATLPTPALRPLSVSFQLDAVAVGACAIVPRATQCDSAPLRTLGWYWPTAGVPQPARRLTATSSGGSRGALALRVAPRPVVLVHGFLSSDRTWLAYTRGEGWLAPFKLTGFAVGDSQSEGAMNMGDPARLAAPTLTLPANAAELARYIAGVKRRTGAEMVDLVAHSMGGLVARYYIARLMQGRDVAQLLMLGTPHGGSDCSALASALGVLAPSSLELRPAYLQQIFNRAVTRRQGVPFHLLAGDAIVDGFKAPCTGVPSDMVVAVDSVAALAGRVSRMPVLHTELTRSEEVFRRFVLPLLSQPAGQFADEGDRSAQDAATPAAEAGAGVQFTQLIKGQVAAGASTELVINLDQVAVASFALLDPSRSLTATVRGASGNVINLTASEHGLVKIDDPTALVHLGYGFNNPRPGPWRVSLQAPAHRGTEFALSVRVVGGALLRAHASTATPTMREAVRLVATLELPGKALQDVVIEAVIHLPSGGSERIVLQGDGAERRADWKPAQAGLHGIDIVARARADQMPIERTTLLAIDVRP